MHPDPYRNLSEILEGTVSLVDYYAHKMNELPASLKHAKAAMEQAIADLRSQIELEHQE